jgi:hypothetical protein
MLRVLRILFFSTHPLKIAKFIEMRKSNVLAFYEYLEGESCIIKLAVEMYDV